MRRRQQLCWSTRVAQRVGGVLCAGGVPPMLGRRLCVCARPPHSHVSLPSTCRPAARAGRPAVAPRVLANRLPPAQVPALPHPAVAGGAAPARTAWRAAAAAGPRAGRAGQHQPRHGPGVLVHRRPGGGWSGSPWLWRGDRMPARALLLRAHPFRPCCPCPATPQLVSAGRVFEVLGWAEEWKQRADPSLVRHLVFGILEVSAPPYSPEFAGSMLRCVPIFAAGWWRGPYCCIVRVCCVALGTRGEPAAWAHALPRPPACSIMLAAGIRRQRLSARDGGIKALLDEFSAACLQARGGPMVQAWSLPCSQWPQGPHTQ